MLLLLIVVCDHSWAGTGGAEFDSVWETLKNWIQGTLGRIVSGSMILVGLIAGVARQSITAFAIGIGGGIGLYNTPNVIESVLSATITNLSPNDIEKINVLFKALVQ
ncbi:MAG: TraA family conjugative transfer protein [Succinivibrionaceae bacterium]